MTITVNLLTSQDDLDSLYKLVDGKKQSIKVDRQKLDRLLIDYGVLTNAVQSSTSFKLIEPAKAARARVRLKTAAE